MMGRCPQPNRRIAPDFDNFVRGAANSNSKNLQFISWALLDYKNKANFVVLN